MNFTPRTVVKVTNATQSQVQYWQRLCLIDPERKVRKRGSRAMYSFKDVLKVQVLASLKPFRLNQKSMQGIMRFIDKHGTAYLKGSILVTDGEDCLDVFYKGAKLLISKPSVYVIHLEHLIAQLEQNIKETTE